MSDILDFQEFHYLLLEASHSAFVSIQELHANESFYAFSLFHEPLWAYILPTSNTEEGLIRMAHVYKYTLGYTQESIQELSRRLRWMSGDWAYHCACERYFDPVNNWLTQNNVYWRYEDDQTKWHEMNN